MATETTAMSCIELQGRCLCVVAVYMRQGSILLFSFLVRSNLDGNLLVGRFLLSRSLELASTGSLFAQLADDNPLRHNPLRTTFPCAIVTDCQPLVAVTDYQRYKQKPSKGMAR